MNGSGGNEGGDDFRMARLESEAPDLHAEAVTQYADSPYDSAAEYVAASVWWDSIDCMDQFGIDTRSVPTGAVLCRECGSAVEGAVGPGHVGGAHGMTVNEYRKQHPMAPVTCGEKDALPDHGIDWSR